MGILYSSWFSSQTKPIAHMWPHIWRSYKTWPTWLRRHRYPMICYLQAGESGKSVMHFSASPKAWELRVERCACVEGEVLIPILEYEGLTKRVGEVEVQDQEERENSPLLFLLGFHSSPQGIVRPTHLGEGNLYLTYQIKCWYPETPPQTCPELIFTSSLGIP